MATRMRLAGLRAVLPAPARAATSPALVRAFASSARAFDAAKTPATKPAPMVGTAGAPQIDMMTGEVTGGADIDVSLDSCRATSSDRYCAMLGGSCRRCSVFVEGWKMLQGVYVELGARFRPRCGPAS